MVIRETIHLTPLHTYFREVLPWLSAQTAVLVIASLLWALLLTCGWAVLPGRNGCEETFDKTIIKFYEKNIIASHVDANSR